MKLIGINFILTLIFALNSIIYCSIFPEKIKKSDYLFIIDIQNQKNYLYFKDTLIDTFDISTGSKNRYKGNREMPEGIWRLTEKIADKEIKRRFKNRAEIYGPRLISLEKFNDNKPFLAFVLVLVVVIGFWFLAFGLWFLAFDF